MFRSFALLLALLLLPGCWSISRHTSTQDPKFFYGTRNGVPAAFESGGHPWPNYLSIPFLPLEVVADVLFLPLDLYRLLTFPDPVVKEGDDG